MNWVNSLRSSVAYINLWIDWTQASNRQQVIVCLSSCWCEVNCTHHTIPVWRNDNFREFAIKLPIFFTYKMHFKCQLRNGSQFVLTWVCLVMKCTGELTWFGLIKYSSWIQHINSLWTSDAIWRFWSTLGYVMACCLMVRNVVNMFLTADELLNKYDHSKLVKFESRFSWQEISIFQFKYH